MLGQTADTGAIAGLVSDPSGALVPGAAVVINSQGTGEKRDLGRDAVGNFSIQFLFPGKYDLTVRAAGFEPFILNVDDHAVLRRDAGRDPPLSALPMFFKNSIRASSHSRLGSGLSGELVSLFSARFFLGLGEAGAFPVATRGMQLLVSQIGARPRTGHCRQEGAEKSS
jgi:hypothetical protein